MNAHRIPYAIPVLAMGVFLLAGCSSGDRAAADAAAVSAAPMDTAAPASGMQAQATQSADQEFLRSLSDHHEGMIRMARIAEQKGSASVKQEAEKMDSSQVAEQKQMVSMLQQQYNDAYTPKLIPSNQAMVDSLQATNSGSDFDMAFMMNTIEHHRQGIQMIDEMLPRLQNPEIRSMAEKMKGEMQQGIQEMQQMMGHM